MNTMLAESKIKQFKQYKTLQEYFESDIYNLENIIARFTDYNSKIGRMYNYSTLCSKACKYCYCIKSLKQYNVVRELWYKNTLLGLQGIIPEIPQTIYKRKIELQVIRLFVGGDFLNVNHCKAIYNMIQKSPQIKFWGFTKQYNNKILKPYIEIIQDLPNVYIRNSIDNIYKYNGDRSIAGILLPDYVMEKGIDIICPYDKKDKNTQCIKCGLCFDDDHKDYNFFFPAH